ncbi:MAG: MotA/TolQ/ExbB proton channel family protein [Oscillospiraceae bacterium]|nr:MotA/TolQ/ExbB proton channel family protein [Oscillospiraceae bacterium]
MENVSVLNTILKNIIGYDGIIFIFAAVTFWIYIKAGIENKKLLSYFDELTVKRKENNRQPETLKRPEKISEAELMEIHFKQDKFYGFFVNLVSIFPLLGMIGTVLALLSLDLSADNGSITNNFFGALTSTFWGAVFGTIFKIVDSSVSTKIEMANEKYNIGIQRKNLDEDEPEENGEYDEA